MNFKQTITSCMLGGAMVLTSVSVAAMDDGKGLSKAELREAESAFQEVCREDNDNSIAECVCVAKVLKEELPSKHYHVLMDLVAHGAADERGEIDMEDEDVERIMERHDVGFFTLVNFTFQIMTAANEFEKCDIGDNGVKLSI